MSGNSHAVDVDACIDLIRPGSGKAQKEFVLLYVECKVGCAVVVVGAYADPDVAEAACESARRRFPYVNACIGPIGAFRPMPPSDYATERQHLNPEVERMFERMRQCHVAAPGAQ
jgi:hypothetical protein